MGNTGLGYDVCSVFNPCLLAPPSPSGSLCSKSSFYLHHHHNHHPPLFLLLPAFSLFFLSLTVTVMLISFCLAQCCCEMCPEGPHPHGTGSLWLAGPWTWRGLVNPNTTLHTYQLLTESQLSVYISPRRFSINLKVPENFQIKVFVYNFKALISLFIWTIVLFRAYCFGFTANNFTVLVQSQSSHQILSMNHLLIFT